MSESSFGSFELLHSLGVNCLGETFFVSKKGKVGFKKNFVLKKLHTQITSNPDFLKILIKEVHHKALLKHPNIVELYDFDKESEEYYCLLEYIDGVNLFELFQQERPIEPKFMLGVIMQLLQALDFAHHLRDENGESLGLIHRDIRPSGVLISSDGLVKLADFGMADLRIHLEKIQSGKSKGKFSYLSPEQVDGDSLSPQVDLFAVGILLYEGLTGHPLFQQDGMLKTLRNVSRAEIPSLRHFVPHIDIELERIVYKALQKNPKKRFQTALEFFNALKTYLNPFSYEARCRLVEKNVRLFTQYRDNKEEL